MAEVFNCVLEVGGLEQIVFLVGGHPWQPSPARPVPGHLYPIQGLREKLQHLR